MSDSTSMSLGEGLLREEIELMQAEIFELERSITKQVRLLLLCLPLCTQVRAALALS